jgi:RNA polymerase sigma-70 factor, ECF subfamily
MLARPTPADPAGEALLSRARSGDRQSQGELLRAHAGLVEWALRRLVGPTPDLEDLVQEVFIEALRGLPRFRGDAQFGTWLHRICVHTASHYLRAPRRRAALTVVSSQEPTAPVDIPENVDARRAFRRAHELLDRLSPPKRVAFLLHVTFGYSTREVAALMGTTHAAAKARIWFARRELDALARLDPALRAWIAGPETP